MATVMIGAGSHATDMLRTLLPRHAINAIFCIDHHTMYTPCVGDIIYIGINDPQTRARVSTELRRADLPWIHPHAHLEASDFKMGTHINYGVTMTRTRIGTHCTISPGVTICGDVTIGDRVLVGAGATICDRVQIGDDVTIGAGTVVLPESVVDSGATIVGVPAKHVATGVHVK